MRQPEREPRRPASPRGTRHCRPAPQLDPSPDPPEQSPTRRTTRSLRPKDGTPMRHRKNTVVIAGAAAATLLLAACGGGNDDAADASTGSGGGEGQTMRLALNQT